MRYYSSDQHFYHANIIRFCDRPFSSVEEMNEILIKNWNDIVKEDDEVIVVGDFSMAFRSVEIFTKRLSGRKILIAGNHDFCHPTHKKSRDKENQKKWTQRYLDNGWAEVHLKMELDLPGIGIVNVSHLPYKGGGDSGYEDRHEKHRLENDERWLICGHVHSSWKIKDKQINVGVDVWNYKPISEEEVIKTILASV